MPTVDVRTKGWGTDCEDRRYVDDSYENQDGEMIFAEKLESFLKCDCQPIDAKHDYCLTCGLILEYP